jgi:hypothetical protein
MKSQRQGSRGRQRFALLLLFMDGPREVFWEISWSPPLSATVFDVLLRGFALFETLLAPVSTEGGMRFVTASVARFAADQTASPPISQPPGVLKRWRAAWSGEGRSRGRPWHLVSMKLKLSVRSHALVPIGPRKLDPPGPAFGIMLRAYPDQRQRVRILIRQVSFVRSLDLATANCFTSLVDFGRS